MKLLLSFLFSFFFSLNLWAEASPVVLTKAKQFYPISLHLDILEDPLGKLTINDVTTSKMKERFKKNTSENPNLGIGKSVFWIRFNVKNEDPSSYWIVSYFFASQDKLAFFRKKGGLWKGSFTGDALKFSSREIKTRGFHFSIRPKGESTYFFRVEGFSKQVILSISSAEYLIEEVDKMNLGYGIFLGLSFMMVIYNVLLFLGLREVEEGKDYLYYVGHVLCISLATAIIIGPMQRFVSGDFPWFNNQGFICLLALSFLFLNIFTARLLHLKQTSPKLYNISKFWSFLWMMIFLFSPALSFRHSGILTIFSLFIFLPILAILVLVGVKNNVKSAKFISAGIMGMILGAIIFSLTVKGVLPSGFWSRNALLIGLVFEMVFLSLGLAINQQEKHLFYSKSMALKHIILREKKEK